jgi:hypothetical protein
MILAEMSNLIGDLARANILLALIDNRALTAKELAVCGARFTADDQLSSRQADGCKTAPGQ